MADQMEMMSPAQQSINSLATIFLRPTQAGIAARRGLIELRAGGKTFFFRSAGRPILMSGDLTAAKRVRRAASLARRKSR